MFLDLREAGEICSKHRVARLMRENRLRALHSHRTRRWEVGSQTVLTPNLLKRRFEPTQPQRGVGDGLSRTSARGRAGCTSPSCSICSPGVVGWAAG
ncbi:MAG: hypothetical protein IPF77_16435 [Gemmatimonadetes bacterium]|nr:hypothetical protein [Gemmatimonadota bacterium]